MSDTTENTNGAATRDSSPAIGSGIFDGLARRVTTIVLEHEEAAWGPVADAIEEELRDAVNQSCSCGGNPPNSPDMCPACGVWHRMTTPNNSLSND